MFLVTTSYNLKNFRCLLTIWNWYFVLVVAYFVRLESVFWGWRWLCCLETGCSEAQYLWFSQRSQDCGIQHDNDTSFNIYIDGRWYCHPMIIHISSIWQWNLYLNHLESMNDLFFVFHPLSSCNIFIMQSCINPPPYIFESVIAGAVCVVASQHWPPFTWAKDIRSFRYQIKYHPYKSVTYRLEKRHEATYISKLRHFSFPPKVS